MSAYVYDIECYSNYFCVTFVPLTTPRTLIDSYCKADWEHNVELKQQILDEIAPRIFIITTESDDYCDCADGLTDYQNDTNDLIEFVKTVKLLIGYNSRGYDNNVLDILSIFNFADKDSKYTLSKLNAISNGIIEYQGINYRYEHKDLYKTYIQPYKSIDLMAVLLETIARKSLKQCAINLKWYRIQDLPYSYGELNYHQKIEVLDYNINDVLITHRLYWHKHEEIVLRLGVGSVYGVDVLNSNRSNMADKLMSKFYEEESGKKWWQFKNLRTIRTVINFDEIINPVINYKAKQLQDFLTKLKSIKFKVGGKFEETVIFKGTGFTIATGGLHSIDRPGIFTADDEFDYIDCDVSSYYPSIIVHERIAPKHLDKASFLQVCKMLIADRLDAKAKKDKTKAEALKITINSGLFGKLGFEMGFLFDLKALYNVTLNGQCYLMMLVEMLEDAGFHVISANTDGLVSKVPRSRYNDYYTICKQWCDLTSFELEYNSYRKYVRKDVNNYIAVKENGEVKTKGVFTIESELSKGYNTPIIAIAIHKFLLEGTDVDTTLTTHDNIYDFCLSQKTGGQFLTEYHHVENGVYKIENITKTNRYYIAITGGTIMKKYKDKNKRISLAANQRVVLFNDYVPKDMKDYKIDYKYYKSEVYKVLHKIYNMNTHDIKGTPSKSGISGTLFDNLKE